MRSIEIRRPIADVFAFVADVDSAKRWRSGVLDIERVSGEGRGAVHRQGVAGPGGRRIAADYEITEFDPPRHLAFRTIAGPVRPTGEYRLEPTADGGTRLTFSLAADIGGWKRFVFSRPVQQTMDAEMAALDRLKAVLEG
jgi:carbon monoxide dehydrogenase subunit G